MRATAIARSVAPAETPITLAEVKAHCRVDFSDDDTLIGSYLAAAVDKLDATGELGRAIVTQTWQQWMPAVSGRVRLEVGPAISLSAVDYYDSDGVLQTDTLTNYDTQLAGDFVTVGPKTGFAWPSTQSRPDAIRLTYTAGYGAAADVPGTIKQALMLLVGHWYETRRAASEVKMYDLPMGVDSLLGVERVGWYG
jgi:uncharacterized phiE125 gp8 family phage protein